jgi:hypothetical protein
MAQSACVSQSATNAQAATAAATDSIDLNVILQRSTPAKALKTTSYTLTQRSHNFPSLFGFLLALWQVATEEG